MSRKTEKEVGRSVGGGGGPDQQQQEECVCVLCVCACDSGHDRGNDDQRSEKLCGGHGKKINHISESGTVFRI